MAATDDAVAEYLKSGGGGLTQTPAQKAQASVGIAVGSNPDYEAELQQAATVTGVPIDSARTNPDAVKNQATLAGFDFNTMAGTSPTTTRFMGQVENARIAHDDTANMVQTEGHVKSLGEAAAATPLELAKGLGGSFNQLTAGLNTAVGAFPAAYDYVHGLMSGTVTTEAQDAYFNSMVTPLLDKAADFTPDANASVPEKLANALGGAAGMLSQIMLTGGEAAALAPAEITTGAVIRNASQHAVKSMAIPGVADAINTGRDVMAKTGDPAAALKAATAAYMATNVMGVIPLSAPGGLLTRVATGSISGEVSGEVAHQLTQAGLPVDMQQPETLDDRIVSAITGGVLGIAGPGAPERIGAADKGASNAQVLADLAKVAEASKLRERNPASFSQFVQDAAKDGPVQDLYIDAQVYAQALEKAGIDPLAVSKTAAAELPVALAGGGDVRIPVQDFATYLPGTGLEKALLPHLKTDPFGMSQAEAETYYQNFAGEQQAQAEKILAESGADSEFSKSADAVKAQLTEQLTQANRFTPDVNSGYATLMSSFYTTQAARLGVTPEELFARYPLRIRADAVTGQALDQGDPKLSVEDQQIQQRFDAKLSDFEAAKQEYAAIPDTKGGRVLNVDTAREMSPDYLKNRTKSNAVHEPASGFIKRLFAEKLKEKAPPGLLNMVLFMAGGTGAGKTTAIEHVPEIKHLADHAQIVYDTNMDNVDSARKKIEDSIEAKKAVVIALVLRDPIDALTEGAIPRAIGQEAEHGSGRTVPLNTHVKTHVGAIDTVHQLALDYADNPLVTIRVIDNSRGRGKAVEVPLANAKKLDYNEIKPRALAALKDIYESGRKYTGKNYTDQAVSEQIFRGFMEGENGPPGAGGDRGIQSQHRQGAGGESEPQRAGAGAGKQEGNGRGVVGRVRDFFQAAFHASPHNFDRFSTKKIGTGEGVQAFGHGLYFAENPQVAETYRQAFSRRASVVYKGQEITHDNPDWHALNQVALYGKARTVAGFEKSLEKFIKTGSPHVVAAQHDLLVARGVDEADLKQGNTPTQYQVDIPDTHVAKMLDWDKPLSEQSETIRAAFKELRANVGDAEFNRMTGGDAYQSMGDAENTSKMLSERGVPGIRYLDAGSRSDNGPDGSHNLVVFDDSIIKLTHKNGKPVTAQERADYLQSSRGQISFGTDLGQGSTIALLHNADLSTFVHESGHFYLEVLNDMASQGNAPPDVVADRDAILKWFGVKDSDAWNAMTLEEKRPYHEQFARGFESYLFEGKAPTVALQGVFAKVRAWMINVYKQLGALNVSVSPEVKQVFDRLLATNKDIIATEAARGMEPMFKSAEAAGMTPDEWARYQALGQEATQSAVDQLQARSLRDLQWTINARNGKLKQLQADAAAKRKGVQHEVTEEVRSEPVYAAQRFFKRGQLAGQETPVTQGHKLSIAALKEMYPADGENPLDYSKLGYGKYGMLAEDGLHPDQAAQMFGFTSGDHLVRSILEAQPERSVIEGKTDTRMLERYGDLSSPQAIERAANAAVHNEARAKFIAAELAAIEKAKGKVRTLARAARGFAETVVARLKIKDLKPARFEAAETKAAKAAETAKDLTEKAVQKRNQLVNNYAAKAAYDAAGEIEKGAKYLKKFDNAGTRKNIDPTYLDQIDQLLERYDLRKISNKDAARRASLADWVKSQEEQGLVPVIPDQLLMDASRKPYREMTVEEFRGLTDAVRNIEHLGRLKKKLLTAADNREFDAARSDVVGSIRENAKRSIPERRVSDRGPMVALGRIFRGFKAMHRKFASFAREFDGWHDGGKVWEYLVRNMNHAGDFEAVEREKATLALHDLLAPLFKEKLGEKKYFPDSAKSFTREERLGIALNMGNDINRERVMTGEHLNADQLNNVLADLSKSDWDTVQGVWDYFESFKPQMEAKQLRLTGLKPEWVEAHPVETPHGTYRGGYYPIKYDPMRSAHSEADINAEVQKQIERGLYVQAQTRKGHLKARTESTGRPLRYDLAVIAEHTDQVIHDLAWHEYLIDANRMLRASSVEDAIRQHYGPEVHSSMKDMLKDIAVGDLVTQSSGDRMLNYLRHGATITGLGFNVANTLINMIGITQSVVRVGPTWMVKGMAHWAGDAASLESSAKKIYAKSEFMRLRAKTQMREINELRNTVANADSALKKAYGKLLPVFFYTQTKTQTFVDIPTFWGAYEKAMAEPEMTESKAVAMADQAVIDAQGSGMTKDLAGIQRGNSALKLFTTFYHFFSTTYNMTAEAVGRTNFRKPSNIAMLTADLALLYTIPALVQTVMMSLLKDDTEPDHVVKRLINDQISYALAPVVLARDATAAVQAAAGVDNGMGYSGPASVRFFSDLANLGKQVGQGEPDEAFWKSLNSVGGTLFHYPSGQINRTVAGIDALAEGRTANPGVLIAGPAPNH